MATEKNYNVFSEIIFEGEDNVKAVELLVNKRKIKIQDLDPCMPLSAYINEDQVLDYNGREAMLTQLNHQFFGQFIHNQLFENEHWDNAEQTQKVVNEHITIFDYSNANKAAGKARNPLKKDQPQEKFKIVYKEMEKDLRNQQQTTNQSQQSGSVMPRIKSGVSIKRKILNAQPENLAKRF